MSNTRLLVTLIVVVVALGLMGTMGLSAEKFNPVAQVTVGSSGITFQPYVSCSKIVLTVSKPDGGVFSRTFDGSGTPYIALSDDKGNYFIDGAYSYELRVIPFMKAPYSIE
ncbi:MAG: hypothetical protein GY757_44605 [bacterium]|nr:hypothetical protein [bacterium]